MSFDCTIEREGDTIVVVPEGDLDADNAALVRQVLQQVVDRRDCTRLDVDMGAVTFLDSSGLGMFVAAHRAAAARGITLTLREPGPMVRMVLEVTNLYDILAPAGPPPEPGPPERGESPSPSRSGRPVPPAGGAGQA